MYLPSGFREGRCGGELFIKEELKGTTVCLVGAVERKAKGAS